MEIRTLQAGKLPLKSRFQEYTPTSRFLLFPCNHNNHKPLPLPPLLPLHLTQTVQLFPSFTMPPQSRLIDGHNQYGVPLEKGWWDYHYRRPGTQRKNTGYRNVNVRSVCDALDNDRPIPANARREDINIAQKDVEGYRKWRQTEDWKKQVEIKRKIAATSRKNLEAPAGKGFRGALGGGMKGEVRCYRIENYDAEKEMLGDKFTFGHIDGMLALFLLKIPSLSKSSIDPFSNRSPR